MVKDIQLNVSPEIAYNNSELLKAIIRLKKFDKSKISDFKIIRRSIDARQFQVKVNLGIRLWISEKPDNKELVKRIEYKNVSASPSVIIVGAGPAGLFAALRLIELGLKPIIFERGKDVVQRRIDIAKISREGIVDPNSNYCFGEGGAGAYSDGKLYTRSKKRGSVNRILSIFYQHGASENILIDAHPHIGSDKLPKIIANIRNTILESGGEVHFESLVTNLIIEGDTVTGVELSSGEIYKGCVILATGHSARDVYRMLHNNNVELESKGIAVGVRLEHPQHLIDRIQYHSPAGRGKYLPAAEYSFVTQVDERGVYSFCMCPGGIIVPAASAENQLVVNGMSPSNRGSYWANSGMVVEVRPEDVPGDDNDVLKVMKFQEALELECFRQAKNSQVAGAQRMKDFVEGKLSKLIPPSSFAPGLQSSRLDLWLPQFIRYRLQKGFRKFGNYAKGFLTNEAIVIGVETRTSSPVRIPRDQKNFNHIRLEGLYPIGEGSGYAGGIVSAAIDGENCAEAIKEYIEKEKMKN